LTKGKPWPIEDERKLKDWFTSGTTDLGILAFSFDGQYTEEAIRQKLIKFELFKEEQQQPENSACCCSSKLELPDELPVYSIILLARQQSHCLSLSYCYQLAYSGLAIFAVLFFCRKRIIVQKTRLSLVESF